MKRRYRRYFIMLEGEDQGFALSDGRNPKGYGKIEVRNDQGVLSLYCQNLKSLTDKGSRYRWYLINTRKEDTPAIVEIGPIEVDENGKGEMIWEFNAANVKGSMTEIDEFNVLVLACQSREGHRNLSAPLIGYIDKEKSPWRRALEKHLHVPSVQRVEEVQEKTEKVDKEELEETTKVILPSQEETHEELVTPEEKIEETHEELVTPEEEIEKTHEELVTPEQEIEEAREEPIIQNEEIEEKPVETTSDRNEDDASESTEDDQPLEQSVEKDRQEKPVSPYSFEEGLEPEINDAPDIHEKVEDAIEEEITPQKSMEGEKNRYQYRQWRELQPYLEKILNCYSKVDPFITNLNNYRWWQIPYNHQTMYRAGMPFITYVDCIKKPNSYYGAKMYQMVYTHQHHIFGICYGEEKKAKYYVYGVPGRKIIAEQPYEGTTGFTYWHPCDPGPIHLDSHGYWLLHIDGATGEVVKPLPFTEPCRG